MKDLWYLFLFIYLFFWCSTNLFVDIAVNSCWAQIQTTYTKHEQERAVEKAKSQLGLLPSKYYGTWVFECKIYEVKVVWGGHSY